MGKRRGQLTMRDEREQYIQMIKEACNAGAKQSKACDIIGISSKTYQRWSSGAIDDGRLNPSHTPANKLSEFECRQIITVANKAEYVDLPPCKIVPKLADKGEYIASESTFYRILKAHNQLQHRQKSKPSGKHKKPKALCATAPNQVYTWDISYLPTQIKGLFLYLYLVMDIFSRKIVGWQIYHNESSAYAADLMTDICSRENISRDQVTLHSDNGGPMKGATMLATLQQLGIMPSFSRPAVSNDNPYSESLFRTLKYRPEYPEKPFADITEARRWMEGFVHWYNEEHLHSMINFVTPGQRHRSEDIALLEQRKTVYLNAKSRHPNRWSGAIRNWDRVNEVYLNPEQNKQVNEEVKAA